MKIVCTSDLHNFRPRFPEGDVLVIAGDLTSMGRINEVQKFADWIASINDDFRYGVVFVAGNHDFLFEQNHTLAKAICRAGTYLEDSGVELGGLKFWGAPWTPQFYDWAFMAEDADLARHWAKIPSDTDVLITHGGPYGILDQTERTGDSVGSKTLRDAIVTRVRPRLHVFGHIHEAYGVERIARTTYVNAAHCDLGYRPVQEPVVITLESED